MRKLNVTDRRTDGRTGGVAISPVPGPTAPAGDNKTQRNTDKTFYFNIITIQLIIIRPTYNSTYMYIYTSTCIYDVNNYTITCTFIL